MFAFFRTDPDERLKRATSLHDAGRFAEAATELRVAYRAISKTDVAYPVDTFLRLPLYLEVAGLRAEAWTEFKRLLKVGFHLMSTDPVLVPMTHSTVYDKMRLFLQRVDRPLMAVPYGLASYYSWSLGLHRQKRFEELHDRMSVDCERQEILKLLRKAKRVDLADHLYQSLSPFRTTIPTLNASLLVKALSTQLNQPTEYEA